LSLRFIGILLFLGILSCGRAPNNSSPAPFDLNQLTNYSANFCTGSQILKEASLPDNSNWEQLGRDNQVFGFYFGDKGCALNHSIYQNDFELIFTNECIPNGSLWKRIDYFVLGPQVEMVMESIKEPTRSHVRIHGNRSVSSRSLRQRTGLRPISCQ
jgi:hypothetical protein